MNEAHDPLEAELAALRPHDVSHALRGDIARCLAGASPDGRRWPWRSAIAGGLVAACLVALWLGPGDGRSGKTRRAGSGPRPEPRSRAEEAVRPTLLAYRRALARSTEELDALFDEQAAGARGPGPQFVQTYAFSRPDRQ